MAALALLLLLCRPPSAAADTLYPAPSGAVAGSYLDHLVLTVNSGLPVSVVPASLPAGLDIVSEEGAEGVNVYLRGTPQYAGSYDCMVNIGDTATICHVDVSPASPSVSCTGDVDCYLDETVQIAVVAAAGDAGVLSYQWYFNQIGTNDYGYEILGATQPTYTVSTAYPGTNYYYCVVTNTNNGLSASVVSQAISVTALENSISAVALQALPLKLIYSPGEALDPTGLQLAVNYSSGETRYLTEGFTVSALAPDVLGEQTVQVDYQGFVCYFSVTVQEKQEIINAIYVLTLPNKIRYTVGETLDTAGLSICADTGLGYREISSGFTCSPTLFGTLGEQEVTVVYAEKSCSFTVTVEEAEHPVSLVVETMPVKTSYVVGESLDITGLSLRQISSRQNSQYIYSGFTCSPNQLTTVGRQEIAVYWNGMSTSFTVTVTEPAAAYPSQGIVSAAQVYPVTVPTAAPTAAPVSTPTAAPTAAPATVPTTAPVSVATAAPTSAPVQPAASPSSAVEAPRSFHSSHQTNLGRSLVGVIVSAAVLALAILGSYVFILNRGGFDAIAEKLEKLLTKRGKSRGGSHSKKK